MANYIKINGDDIEFEDVALGNKRTLSQLVAPDTQSAGYVSGGLITAVDPANGKVNISAVKGFLKITDSEIGVTKSFDLAGTTEFVLTDKQTNYIFVNFVGGPKFDVTTTRSDIELNRQFTLGRVFRNGINVHIIQSGIQLPNFLRRSHERLLAVRGFEQASGGAISESGNRYLASENGVFYLGNNKSVTSGVNTNNAATFKRHYHAAGPVWTSDTKSQIAEGGAGFYKYDDGTALQNISNNKYGIFWIFIHFDGDLHVVVGRGDYTLAEAQAATVPEIPNELNDFATLAAKIILLEDATNFLSVQGAYEVFFPLDGGFNHNDLGLIQGGAADDYYHLTGTEHDDVIDYSSTIASSATPTPVRGAIENYFDVTALAEAAEFAAPTGTPQNHDSLVIRIKDNGTARALTWNAIYRGIVDTLPTTTTISKTMYIGFMYNTADSKWDMVALAEEA